MKINIICLNIEASTSQLEGQMCALALKADSLFRLELNKCFCLYYLL